MMCALALLAAAWLALAGAAGAGATGLGAGAAGSEWCPSLGAGCACGARGARLQCRGAGLRHMPPLNEALLYLDVSHNNISTLPRDALHPAAALRDLNLSFNRLESVSAGALSAGAGGNGSSLQRLVLDGCGLRQVPAHALRDMPALLMLSLEDNELSELEAGALGGVRGVRTLRLAGNRLRRVPGEALAPLAALAVLVLSGNQLTSLPDDALPPLPALHTLLLQRNRITHIEERAFAPTPALVHLRLDDNLLTELPAAVQLLPALRDLSLGRNRVEWVGAEWLRACAALAHLDLRANPLGRLHASALDHLPRLNTLVLSSARALRSLPALSGARALRTVHADRARLTRLPPALCRNAPQLRRLDLKLNQFTRLPDLSQCKELRVLDLSSNSISSLAEAETAAEAEPGGEGEGGAGAGAGVGGSLAGLARLQDLVLARNLIRRVPRHAFQHTPALQTLNLEDNAIEHIDAEAFVPIRRLEDLNVGGGVFASLPAAGLQHVLHLKAHNNPQLRTFHPPQAFPRVQTLVLSYAYHCCEFLPLMEGGSGSGSGSWPGGGEGGGGVRDLVLPAPRGADARLWGNDTELIATYANGTAVGVGVGGEWEPSEAELRRALEALAPLPRHVTCLPLPGPFLPCEDLFDWWTLRCGVWAVFLLALLGNGTVVVVLLWSRSRLDVPRFLVTNLAAADLCMGVYLGLLAVVDAATLGEFRAHAVAWQLSGACRLAGFLGVLSAELSVYTLAVITLERNYAITHAMHLNKRLSLRRAGAVMAAGWALALAAAALPLLGVSDYRKFAVCLPFETESPAALGYVAALLAANGLAFLVLLGCYLKMYCAIRGSQAWNSNDSRIARRMALLVFTDFVCWAPVALCALCAAAGARLVSLEQAKVLTVFVLPLNSCCNPFLYAILTKQFKKDCALVCKAIEESRVTRGIGRCRHSSNFSNRQTPANTNSLAERSERAHHGATCACRRLLPAPAPAEPARPTGLRARAGAACRRWARRVLRAPRARARARTPAPPPPGAARAGGGGRARAGSVSSSVEFSSSRSDSWRAGGGAGAGAGAPRPAPARRTAPWLVARKTSQDSNLSSSRNDSSGSNATASTGTWRTSRSGGGAPAGPVQGPVQTVSSCGGPRPRLTRQPAVSGDEPPLSPPPPPGALWSPPPLAPRLLHTIPSAAEADPPPDELGAR